MVWCSYGCRNVILRAIKEYESRRLSAQDLKGMRELVEFVEREVRDEWMYRDRGSVVHGKA